MYLSSVIFTVLCSATCISASPAPETTPAPSLENAIAKRSNDSCTFSGSLGYSSASVSKKSCSTIVLSDLQVPGGKTLNLEKLNAGTTVGIT